MTLGHSPLTPMPCSLLPALDVPFPTFHYRLPAPVFLPWHPMWHLPWVAYSAPSSPLPELDRSTGRTRLMLIQHPHKPQHSRKLELNAIEFFKINSMHPPTATTATVKPVCQGLPIHGLSSTSSRPSPAHGAGKGEGEFSLSSLSGRSLTGLHWSEV